MTIYLNLQWYWININLELYVKNQCCLYKRTGFQQSYRYVGMTSTQQNPMADSYSNNSSLLFCKLHEIFCKLHEMGRDFRGLTGAAIAAAAVGLVNAAKQHACNTIRNLPTVNSYCNDKLTNPLKCFKSKQIYVTRWLHLQINTLKLPLTNVFLSIINERKNGCALLHINMCS